MVYQRDQAREMFKFVLSPPKWFILGGPADGNEAQCAVQEWPGVEVLAVEPSEKMVRWQHANGWPPSAKLLNYALWDSLGDVRYDVQADESMSEAGLQKHRQGRTRELSDGGGGTASAVTLDFLSAVYGPFENVLLWLDVEGAEYRALQGAQQLFSDDAIDTVSVEVDTRRPENVRQVADFFWLLDFEFAGVWLPSAPYEDRVYRRKKRRWSHTRR